MTSIVRDHGAGGSRKGVLVKRVNCYSYRCVSCDHLQYESKSRSSRAAAITCDKCGGIMDLSKSAQKKSGIRYGKSKSKERKCRGCGKNVNSYNTSGYCFQCSRPNINTP